MHDLSGKTVRLERKNNHGYFKATWKTYYFLLRAAWVPFYSKMDLPGELPEVWNVGKPEFILNVHREYLKAGCDIVKTNTFGANSIKMEDSGYTAKELIEKQFPLQNKQ